MWKTLLATIALLFVSVTAMAQSQFWHGPSCHLVKNDPTTCMACAVYYEAKSESLMGKMAVAFVAINRTRSGEFPKSVCGVVWQRVPSIQYQWTANARLVPNNPVQWQDSLKTARAIIDLSKRIDYEEWDFTRNSTFFHAVYVNPRWRYSRTMQVGNHILYALPGKMKDPRCTTILETEVGC